MKINKDKSWLLFYVAAALMLGVLMMACEQRMSTEELTEQVKQSMIENFDLKIGGVTTQGAFLSKLGIENRAENLSKQSRFSEKANIYFRLRRLIDPRHMGELFKVVFVCKKKNNFKLALK